MVPQIFKVQIDATGTRACFYTEGHQNMGETHDENTVDELMFLLGMEALTKKYVEGHYNLNGEFEITNQHVNQERDW